MSSQEPQPASETAPPKLDPTTANIGLSALAVAAAVGFYFGGGALRLASAAVLLLLPGVLIFLVNREPLLYGLIRPKRDPRTDLDFAFFACGAGPLLGNLDIHFVETVKMVEFAVLIGLLCCVLIFGPARKNPKFWSTIFGMFFLGSFVGWGFAATLDSAPDRSTPAYYTAMVEGQYETYHRGASYHIELAPWGPELEPQTLEVSASVYRRASIGVPMCIELRLGLLRVQWYQFVPCEDETWQ